MKKETLSERAARLEWERDTLALALIAMTHGEFDWGPWKRSSPNHVQVRYGVGKSSTRKEPILLREKRNVRTEKSFEVVVLTVDQLFNEPAFQVNTSSTVLHSILQNAQEVDGRWVYEWPAA